MSVVSGSGRAVIEAGTTALGVEFGSTRIKACLVDVGDPSRILATGAHEWENQLVDGVWTYSLDAVWAGLQDAYRHLASEVERVYDVPLRRIAAVGVSAMMHGYLAFDESGDLLVPFRTWRNTGTARAAHELTESFGVNIPLRWSVAHVRQAMLDAEPHVESLTFMTTLAGYVHWKLTGRPVLGVTDASGMFPIDASGTGYDADMQDRFDRLVDAEAPGFRIGRVLPLVLTAGERAGELTEEGAALIDPAGLLQPGSVFCPPEGDAGTGMVATDSVAPRTGNVSVGTSTFAMVVLEEPMRTVHEAIDVVTTPSGHPVAMVHCNNGASELAEWVGLFGTFARLVGADDAPDAVYETLFREALSADPDAGGLLAFNHLSGEPIAGVTEGRPLVVRPPDGVLTLGNFIRAQLYGVFGTLALGMSVLAGERVQMDRMLAHGGVFRTAGVMQRVVAGVLDVPVSVASTASEGGAWGIAVLAAYARAVGAGDDVTLETYLSRDVFDESAFETVAPEPHDVEGFALHLSRYRAGLELERRAADSIPLRKATP